MNDAAARRILEQAWQIVHPNRPLSLAEAQGIQAQGAYEGSYGQGGIPNNWGAIQCSHAPPAREGECIEWGDHFQNGKAFVWCYKVYPTPVDGAADLIKLVTTRRPKAWAALKKGDAHQYALELYRSRYYSGIAPGVSKEVAERKVVEQYTGALERHSLRIATNVDEGKRAFRDRRRKDPKSKTETPNVATVAAAFATVVYVLTKMRDSDA